MEELKNVCDGSYNLQDEIFFTANGKRHKMSARGALEIAYTLFDSVGYSYEVLDEISNKLD